MNVTSVVAVHEDYPLTIERRPYWPALRKRARRRARLWFESNWKGYLGTSFVVVLAGIVAKWVVLGTEWKSDLITLAIMVVLIMVASVDCVAIDRFRSTSVVDAVLTFSESCGFARSDVCYAAPQGSISTTLTYPLFLLLTRPRSSNREAVGSQQESVSREPQATMLLHHEQFVLLHQVPEDVSAEGRNRSPMAPWRSAES